MTRPYVGLDDVLYENVPRQTPRRTVIVVLPDNHAIPVERLADRLPRAEEEAVDVILACAGEPVNLGALARRIRDYRILLAPAGTSKEDLRELAVRQTHGDVVTLLTGLQAGTAA